jgi:SAM-dependent methyltransferase
VFDIQEYDGVHIPFPDSSFDCVYSSNVLEHIPHLDAFEQEIHRVLAPGGLCLHILPTHTWRFWTSLTHYPSLPKLLAARLKQRQETTTESAHQPASSRSGSAELDGGPRSLSRLVRQGLRLARSASFPKRHGERGNVITELGYFHPRYWRWHFEHTGWQVENDFPVGYLYTGYDLMGRRLSSGARAALARVLGSSCHAYVLSSSS